MQQSADDRVVGDGTLTRRGLIQGLVALVVPLAMATKARAVDAGSGSARASAQAVQGTTMGDPRHLVAANLLGRQ